nr:hypothetical protein CFP56_33649 [Quercus suber]
MGSKVQCHVVDGTDQDPNLFISVSRETVKWTSRPRSRVAWCGARTCSCCCNAGSTIALDLRLRGQLEPDATMYSVHDPAAHNDT